MKRTFVSSIIFLLCISLGGLQVLSMPAFSSKETEVISQPEGILAASDNTLADSGYTCVAKDGPLELYFQDFSCNIAVLDTKNNRLWYSNPPNAADDEVAQGAIRMDLQSQLIVRYCDEQNQKFFVNSKVGSVKQGTYEVKNISGGVKVIYDFSREKENFIIPVSYTLKDGRFYYEVHFNEIKERDTNKVLEVRALPYFGAAMQETDGYLFVPDGCGALVDFKANHVWADSYQKRIYGNDPTQSNYLYTLGEETVRLPVFGIVSGRAAFYASVNSADANGWIEAVQAGKQSSYAVVAAGFAYRYTDDMALTAQYSKDSKVTFISAKPISENPIVQYTFLAEDKANYVGMATAYREDLMRTCGMKKLETSHAGLTVELIGAVQKRESFFGLPLNKTVPITTLSDATTILGSLNDAGVNHIETILYHYGKKGTGASIPLSFKVEEKLGGKKQFQKLQAAQDTLGNRLYMELNYIDVHSSQWGYWSFNSAAKSLFRTNLFQYSYKPSTMQIDKSAKLSYYLRPVKIQASFEKFLQFSDELKGAGVCLTGMGYKVYSDYNTQAYSDRDNTKNIYRTSLKKAKDKGIPVLSDGANAYLFCTANSLTNVPLTSSANDIFTKTVPFYQIALHGLVSTSSIPINNATDEQTLFLQCLVTGTQMNFQLTGKSPTALQDSVLETVYSSYYLDWLEDIAGWYKEYATVQQELQNQYIMDYSIEGELHSAVYENGTRIAVNFSDKDMETSYGMVKAKSYLVKK